MNLSTFFDRIYIKNLPHRTDRREAVIKELQSVGIFLKPSKVEIFPGFRPAYAEPFHSLGSKGNFLSTLEILRQARAHQTGHILIFEDDVKFPSYFKEYESVLLEQLETQHWDIAQFAYGKIEIDSQALDVPFATWIDTPSIAIGSHFFAINSGSLERYIAFLESLLTRPRDHPEGGPMPIDGTFAVFRQLNPDVVRLVAVPSFGDQRSSRSDVTPKWFDNVPVLSDLASLYREFANRR